MEASQILLTGRNIVVTGAARGIGKATALAFADLGANIAVCDMLDDELAATAAEIEERGVTVLAESFDVRDAERVGAFMARAHAEMGPVDVLVNNAGGGFWAPFADVSAKGEQALVSENFSTVTNCVRAAMPLMADGGSIINVTSVEAYHAAPGFAVYAAMKAAVQQFTQSLAVELGARSIRVNCVAPDMIPTPETPASLKIPALSSPACNPLRWGVPAHPKNAPPSSCSSHRIWQVSLLVQPFLSMGEQSPPVHGRYATTARGECKPTGRSGLRPRQAYGQHWRHGRRWTVPRPADRSLRSHTIPVHYGVPLFRAAPVTCQG